MLIASHHVLLSQGAAAVPEWVHLVPAGTFKGVDGRGPFTLANAQAVIDASMADGKLPIDENHATDRAMRTGQPSPARGWIVNMRAEPDGIHAQVDWTESGKALMSDRAYRGVSPVFTYTAGGVITRVLRAALTNTPNLAELPALNSVLTAEERHQMPAEMFAVPGKKELPIRDPDHVKLAWDMVDRTQGLTAEERTQARRRIMARARELHIDTSNWNVSHHAQNGESMDLKALRAALGLPETADEAAILAAVTANAAGVAAHSQQISAIATAAGLPTNLTPDALATALQTQRSAGDPADLARQVVSLQTQLSTIEKDRAREKAVAFVDGQIRAGKPINALRDHYIARHMADAAGVETELAGLPSINVGGVPSVALNAQGQPDADAPTAAERAVAAKMNIDPKKLMEQRKKREAGEGSSR